MNKMNAQNTHTHIHIHKQSRNRARHLQAEAEYMVTVSRWHAGCTCNACLLWKHLYPYHCAPQKWQGWVQAVAQRTNLKFPCAPHPSEHTWCFAPSFVRALWQPRLVQASPSLDTPWHRCTPVLVDMSLGDGPGTILQGCNVGLHPHTHFIHPAGSALARVHCERENFQTMRKREPRQEAVVAAYARVQYLQQPGQAMMSRRPCTTPTPSDSIRFNFRAQNLGDARRFLATLPHTNEKYVQGGMGEVRGGCVGMM